MLGVENFLPRYKSLCTLPTDQRTIIFGVTFRVSHSLGIHTFHGAYNYSLLNPGSRITGMSSVRERRQITLT